MKQGQIYSGRWGLTLIESMILLVVLSIVSVGVGIGLQAAVRVPEASERALAISAELTSEMENWRSVAFGASPWPATLPYTLTDTVSITLGGQARSFARATAIATWDPNNLASDAAPKADFARVSITINGQTLVAYFTNPN